MKTYITLIFLVTCLLACSHGFPQKEVSNPISKIAEVKKEFVTDAQGIVSELKESAKLKKQALVDSVKAVAKVKSAVANGIKEGVLRVKSNLVKGVQAVKSIDFSALKAAKHAYIKKLIDTKKAQLKKIIAAISAKTHDLYQHKLAIKEKATTLLSSAASKVYDGISSKKKQLLSKFQAPAETSTLVLLPLSQEPTRVHTYVSNEEPIIGKVFVQEEPFNGYGPPPNSYGPPADNYGPPADTYGPAV